MTIERYRAFAVDDEVERDTVLLRLLLWR